MPGAEMGAAGADYQAGDSTFAPGFRARLSSAPVSAVMFLEFTFFSLDISVVRHRVSAEIYTSLKRMLQSNEH